MVLKKEQPFKTIIDGLSSLRTACAGRGKQGLFDLHILAESFFCPFLNEVYGLNLKVLKTGQPGIDLGDPKTGIAFQITSDDSKAKIQDTLTTYSAKKLFATYPSLKILIIGERRPVYTITVPKGVKFDQATDILDVHLLGAEIKPMGAARIGRLADIVSAEIVSPDVQAKGTKAADRLEVSLNGEMMRLPETACPFAPYAGWGVDLVLRNTSREVMEAEDYSIAFVLPHQLCIKDDWTSGVPDYNNPVVLNKSETLYQLGKFSRLLPGARVRSSVVIGVDEKKPVKVGDTIAIKVHAHTKHGQMEYPVKLVVATGDKNLAALQQRAGKASQANQAAILQLNSFIQTLEGGSKNLPPVSWKRTFGPLDSECAQLTKKQMIQRLFSTTDHQKLVLYLGALRGMYAASMLRGDIRNKYAKVCLAFGVSPDELV
jgi:hypothetical protein